MRWVWLAVTVFGLGLAYMTHSPGWLALGLLVGFIGMFCMVFAIASDRIQAHARADSAMLTPEVLAQIRARAKSQQSATVQPTGETQLDESRP